MVDRTLLALFLFESIQCPLFFFAPPFALVTAICLVLFFFLLFSPSDLARQVNTTVNFYFVFLFSRIILIFRYMHCTLGSTRLGYSVAAVE